MSDKTHTYTNGEVTIVWKPSLCTHSKRCWLGLPAVFKPGQRPWILPEGADTQAIVDQVGKCPSGALSIRMNDEGGRPEDDRSIQDPT
ncbi:MAG: (4Fe-4S)-binding protein [Flavobacteriales bacterium]|nr:(4Fe-4S)-binding protein [Flavobacteriales bacterium]